VEGDAVKIEDKLYSLRWKHDRQSHISITDNRLCRERCPTEWKRPCTTFCPANVYNWDGDKIAISYENCVECTSCVLGCPYRNIDWRLPRGGFGIEWQNG
jgi:ferredoxin like protein